MGRKKTEIKLKEPVRIREARRSDGNISLYLDIYSKGMRKREGLKHYLVPEINSAAKVQNANTRKLAEQIKAQRILDIQTKGLVDWEGVKRSHRLSGNLVGISINLCKSIQKELFINDAP